jgi:hypothetical protein
MLSSVYLRARSVSLCVRLLVSHRDPRRISEIHRDAFLCVPPCPLCVALCEAFDVTQRSAEVFSSVRIAICPGRMLPFRSCTSSHSNKTSTFIPILEPHLLLLDCGSGQFSRSCYPIHRETPWPKKKCCADEISQPLERQPRPNLLCTSLDSIACPERC